jgi:hypothetical protein
MPLDRVKLRAVLDGLKAGDEGAAGLYGTYLDSLPKLFGSQKLADEADLILAALTAAETAYAEAVEATAPVAIEPAGQDENGEPLFRATKTARVGGLPTEWTGVPLYALASVLDRARERQSIDDEVYAASFVYVLFRLKAALGVWRADASPDARYRVWLKDFGKVIAAHPRLGPKVTACHARIARALLAEGEAYVQSGDDDERGDPPAVMAAFGPVAFRHAELGGERASPDLAGLARALWAASFQARREGDNSAAVRYYSGQLGRNLAETLAPAERWNDLASAYMNRGTAKQSADGNGPGAAIEDYGQAITIMEALRRALEPKGLWRDDLRNVLALAYMNRGNAKHSADGHGPGAAIEDYGQTIDIMEALRRALEPKGRWRDDLRNDLAKAYVNRGIAKESADGHGPGAAIEDYGLAIDIREALRRALEPKGLWRDELRNDLAKAYVNRGVAKRSADGHGPGAAIEDYGQAITIMEALRRALEPKGRWRDDLRNDLARAYMNRGTAKESADGHGPGAAIEDYDQAITIMEALRRALEPKGLWRDDLRNDLARAYMNRGTAKQSADWHGPGAAIEDYDQAITIMEALRRALEPKGLWRDDLRNDLALAYYNRGCSKRDMDDRGGACVDARAARQITAALLLREGARAHLFFRQVAAAVERLEAEACRTLS